MAFCAYAGDPTAHTFFGCSARVISPLRAAAGSIIFLPQQYVDHVSFGKLRPGSQPPRRASSYNRKRKKEQYQDNLL